MLVFNYLSNLLFLIVLVGFVNSKIPVSSLIFLMVMLPLWSLLVVSLMMVLFTLEMLMVEFLYSNLSLICFYFTKNWGLYSSILLNIIN